MNMWKNLDICKSFVDLQQTKAPDIAALLSDANAASRVTQYSVPMPFGMHYNYAAKQVDETQSFTSACARTTWKRCRI